jgi:alpha-mannosidase
VILIDLKNAAKFEVCGHHWADLSEFGFGVALLNDCKCNFYSTDILFYIYIFSLSLFSFSDTHKNVCIYVYCGE